MAAGGGWLGGWVGTHGEQGRVLRRQGRLVVGHGVSLRVQQADGDAQIWLQDEVVPHLPLQRRHVERRQLLGLQHCHQHLRVAWHLQSTPTWCNHGSLAVLGVGTTGQETGSSSSMQACTQHLWEAVAELDVADEGRVSLQAVGLLWTFGRLPRFSTHSPTDPFLI